MLRKILIGGFLSLSLIHSASAQKFGRAGGVGSTTSTFNNGEPVGGTFSINGVTGVGSFPSVNLKTRTSPVTSSNGDLWSTADGLYLTTNGVTQKLQGSVWSMPTDPKFGAKCDGNTDDTTALQAWMTAAGTGAHLRLPNSSCVYKSPLKFPSVNGVTLSGSGRQSQLLYAGSSTVGTLITFGGTILQANLCSVNSWTVRDVKFASKTVMTAGDGVLIKDTCEMDFDNIAVGGDIDGDQNFWNGIHFSGGNSLHVRGYSFSAKNAAEIINGDPSQPLTDIFHTQGKISHSAIGLQIAGNAGGVVFDQSDILLNGVNVLVDTTQVARSNAQIFFGSTVAIDLTNANPNTGVSILDPGINPQESQIFFNGTWIASSQHIGADVNSGSCVRIASSAVNWAIHFNGGTITNCQNDGITNDSTTSVVTVSGTYIAQSGRYGINSTVKDPYLQISGVMWPVFYGVNAVGNLGNNAVNAGTINTTTNPSLVLNGNISGAGPTSQILINDSTNSNGAGITLTGNGTTTPQKTIRAYSGSLQVLNNNYTASILTLSDAGSLDVLGYSVNGVSGVSCSGPPTASYVVTAGIVTHC